MPRYSPGKPSVSGGFRTWSFPDPPDDGVRTPRRFLGRRKPRRSRGGTLRAVVLPAAQLEAEVAVRGALHHGLRARQLHRGIEALHQREVAIAREQRPDLRDAERAVHLGVAAAGDVERELLVGLLEHVHAVGVALLPVLQRGGEVTEAVATHALRQRLALLAGHVDDDPPRDLEHALPAE